MVDLLMKIVLIIKLKDAYNFISQYKQEVKTALVLMGYSLVS